MSCLAFKSGFRKPEKWTEISPKLTPLVGILGMPGGAMGRIHKPFSNEQVAFLLDAYLEGRAKSTEVQEILGVGRSRFFELLQEYRRDPEGFAISYGHSVPPRLSPSTKPLIQRDLLREKNLVEEPRLPSSSYN